MTGVVTKGPFANWTLVGSDDHALLWRNRSELNSQLPLPSHIKEVMNMSSYDCFPWNASSICFRNYFEGFLPPPRDMHNVVHVYIGGAMRNITISANDPIFYLHH